MAQLLNRVQRGDVITADMWNLVVDTINELLQSGQTIGISIAALVPKGTPEDPIRIGTVLEITGQNFGYSIGQASATFEWQAIRVVVPREKMLLGSSDSRLVFIVPPIPSIPEAGGSMTLRVDNGVASDPRTVFVKPVVITLSGYVFVHWRADMATNPNPNPLQIIKPVEFAYQLETAGLTMPASFDLSADIVDATAAIPSDLVKSIEFRDGTSGALISSKNVEMGKNETRNIVVRIPQIPQTWANQTFSLIITATSGQVTNTDRRPFTVGKEVISSNDVLIQQLLPNVFRATEPHDGDPNQQNGKVVGATLQLKAGWLVDIPFNVTFKQAGTYDISIAPKAGTTLNDWSLTLLDTLTPKLWQKGDTMIATFEVRAPLSPPPANAATSGTIVFNIQRQGAEVGQAQEYSVQLWQ